MTGRGRTRSRTRGRTRGRTKVLVASGSSVLRRTSKRKLKGESSSAHLRRSKRLKREDEEFEVTRIVDSRETLNGIEYKVEWSLDKSCTWELVENLNCTELLEEYKVEKMRRHIIQRKIAPSSFNNCTNQDVQNAFTALVGEPYLAWKLPGKRVAQASVLRRHVSPQANFFLDKMSTSVQENTEQGMYGRATLLLVEMVSLYSDIFPNGVELKVCAPLKSGDGKTMIDYAMLIVYVNEVGRQLTLPTLIVEIKREITVDLQRVTLPKLSQCLLESLYIIHERAQPSILACLTDLSTFHVMKVEQKSASTVAITEYTTVSKDYDAVLHILISSIKHLYEEIV